MLEASAELFRGEHDFRSFSAVGQAKPHYRCDITHAAWQARQAEAEREKRAKIIHAEGENQASLKLTEAADTISRNPTALQLRYLQTLTEIAAEHNSTILFPLPIEFMRAMERLGGKGD